MARCDRLVLSLPLSTLQQISTLGHNIKQRSTVCECVCAVQPPSSTDLFTDNRDVYTESECGVDYASSALCAFAGYAREGNGEFDHCVPDGTGPAAVRTPLTSRL